MAREVIFDVQGQTMRAGQTVGPFVVPVQKLAGATTAYLTVTVDDPTVDPPTDAQVSGSVDASDDNGASWYTVVFLWGGTSGILSGMISINQRRLRAQGHADLPCRVNLLVEVE